MPEAIAISSFQKGEEIEIFEFIKRVYDEFVSSDYTDEGNMFFYNFISAENIAERFDKNKNIILTAKHKGKIVGMIEIRGTNQISLLFVDKSFQGQGIAKKLFAEALRQCINTDVTLKTFYVHASPFSIPIYQKLRFTKTAEIQEVNGIKYLPMEMIIKS